MIIFNQPLPYFIIPGYAVALTLTLFGSDDLVCVSWDSAGVATGPVVVPLVLAIGVALGNSLHVIGFGIVALASVCPIGMSQNLFPPPHPISIKHHRQRLTFHMSALSQ